MTDRVLQNTWRKEVDGSSVQLFIAVAEQNFRKKQYKLAVHRIAEN